MVVIEKDQIVLLDCDTPILDMLLIHGSVLLLICLNTVL